VSTGLPAFYPWQTALAQRWLSQRERFAHAWLIHGLPGIGKVAFARAAAASLLCESPVQGLACGACAACAWTAAGHHPDLRLIRPDAVAIEEGEVDTDNQAGRAAKTPSRDIRVEQLRELSNWFNTATHRGGWRVAVIYPADAMNAITANALLKVLEEPPAHTVFLLVAHAPDRLLPTLVSRCRRLPLSAPSQSDSLQWLQSQGVEQPATWLAAAGGAPLRAWAHAQAHDHPYPKWLPDVLQMMESASEHMAGQLADQLDKLSTAEWVDPLQRMLVDVQLACAGAAPRYYPALDAAVSAIARRASPASIAETASWLLQQRALAQHPLNTKLLAQTAMHRLIRAGRSR